MLIWSILFLSLITYGYIICEEPLYAYPISMFVHDYSNGWIYYLIVFFMLAMMIYYMLHLESYNSKFSNTIAFILAGLLASLLFITERIQPAHNIIAGLFMFSICIYIKVKTIRSSALWLHLWTSVPFIVLPFILKPNLTNIGIAENVIIINALVSLNYFTWSGLNAFSIFSKEDHQQNGVRFYAYGWAIVCVTLSSFFGIYNQFELVIPILHFSLCYFLVIKSYRYRFNNILLENMFYLISGPLFIILINGLANNTKPAIIFLAMLLVLAISSKYLYQNNMRRFRT